MRASIVARTFVAMLRRLGLLCALFVGGCHPTSSLPDTYLTVTEPDGSNPLTGRSLTHARAYFIQDVEGAFEDYVESDIVDGTFDLRLPIGTFSAPMTTRIELSSTAGVELVGGSPSFYPAELPTLKVLVGAPGSCGIVADLALSSARSAMGAALIGGYVLLSGGVDSAPSVAVDAVDVRRYTMFTLTNADSALGATRSAPIDRTSALVVSSGRVPYVHRIYVSSATLGRPEPTLHVGARTADAVVSAPGYGAVVVGGGDDAAPSNEISWVGPRLTSDGDEQVVIGTLASAVKNRAASFVMNGLWVVSSDDTNTSLEQFPPRATTSDVRISMINDGVRRGASLVFDPSGTTGLLFGGVDQNGVVRTDTLAFTGCPAACAAAPGPTWTNARTGFALDPSGIVVGGSPATSQIERVVFPSGVPTIQAYGSLAVPRRDPGVVRLAGGPIVVFGGADLSVPRGDVEACFPAP